LLTFGEENNLNKRKILSELENQLATKGLNPTEGNGDLLVDVRLSAKERKEATAYTSGGCGGYRYGGGFQTTSVKVQAM